MADTKNNLKKTKRASRISISLKPSIFLMAGATRLELAASCVTGRRSDQLNYAPAWGTSKIYIKSMVGETGLEPVTSTL